MTGHEDSAWSSPPLWGRWPAGQRGFARAAKAAFLLLLFLFAALPARAEEMIRSYHSDIIIEKSGKLNVTETIVVNAEGNKIRRGIFRDFPLTFEGPDGAIHRVDFKITGIERDGGKEEYFTETIDGGIRIYIGNKDTYLSVGQHSFKISYETGRQIRYFDKHEELFWNVTGNGWDFRIASASADVTLPPGVRPEANVFFTGPLGATERNATSSMDGAKVHFETTGLLNLHEGLTIGVKMPKGSIDPPSSDDQFWWGIADRWNGILAGIGFLLVFAYFSIQWVRFGRDPARGVIVPRWDPPEGLSPALVNYIDNRGFSNGGWTAFSASALNLAVKGYVTLDDLGTSLRLTRTANPPADKLPRGEDIIMTTMGASYAIDKANGASVQRLGESFRTAIDKDHSGKYHRYNAGAITLGILLTIACYLGVILLGNFNSDTLGLMVVPAVLFLFVAVFSAILGATVMASPVFILRIFAGFFLAVFWVAMALVIGVSIWQMAATASPGDTFAFGASVSMIVVAIFFIFIMGAATPLGRQLRDGIDGLRLYLTVAEQDRMNMAGAPTMSPKHFETLLPYAVALGVEKPWASTFQHWLDTAGAAAATYDPGWYHGRDFDSHRFGERISNFSSSMSSTISSTLPPPPKSSSSGFSSGSSGGSSGGGGGGGGGGGW